MRTFFMGGLGAEGAIRDPKIQKKDIGLTNTKSPKNQKSSKSARESTTRPETYSG